MKCSCCGTGHDLGELTALRCRPEVRVCRDCIGWLAEQSGAADVTPVLPVLDMDAAVVFYETAGFDVRVYEGGGFAFVTHEDQSVSTSDSNPRQPVPARTWSSRTPTTGTTAYRAADSPSRRSPTRTTACASSPSPTRSATGSASAARPDLRTLAETPAGGDSKLTADDPHCGSPPVRDQAHVKDPMFGLIVQAAGMFAVTNIDDLLLLALYFGRARGHRASELRVVAGQFLGLGGILTVSLLAAFGLSLLSEDLVAYLGLLPIALGIRAGVKAWQHRRAAGDDDAPPGVKPAGTVEVASVTFATAATTSGSTCRSSLRSARPGPPATWWCSWSWSPSGALRAGSSLPGRPLRGCWPAGATSSCR